MQPAPFSPVAFGLWAAGLAGLGLGALYVGWTHDEWLGLLCGGLGGACFLLPWFILREHQEDVARCDEGNEKLQSHTLATKLYMERQRDRMQDILLEYHATSTRRIEAAEAEAAPFKESRKRALARRGPKGQFTKAKKVLEITSEVGGASDVEAQKQPPAPTIEGHLS